MSERRPQRQTTPPSPEPSFPEASRHGVRIQVNGEPREIPGACSVRALLDLLGVEGKRIAVAVNRAVVPRSAYETHCLAAGDHVEILEAVGGG